MKSLLKHIQWFGNEGTEHFVYKVEVLCDEILHWK